MKHLFNRNDKDGIADTHVIVCTAFNNVLRKNKYKNNPVHIWKIIKCGWFSYTVEFSLL